ncbi:murein hydrolase activator EnvC family protein [Kitasatospora sp. NPDC089509]|uniref:murein hydrolase activator EnvC family protein n=1 Tax=Kitasatospora sp. NPDC089509 TaxID=3364079 RepID=UPI003821C2D3
MTGRSGVRGVFGPMFGPMVGRVLDGVVPVVVLALVGFVGVTGAAAERGPGGTTAGGATVPGPARAWPVGGPSGVLGRFEPPAKPWAAGHRGVDLAAAPGAEVRAAAAGVIAFSGLVAGRPVVTVTHPDSGAPPLRTTYLPVIGALPVGTAVAAGQVIGRLAPDGRHCGAHDCLHWGLLRGDRYLDPLALFGAGRARLLPLGGAGHPADANGTDRTDGTDRAAASVGVPARAAVPGATGQERSRPCSAMATAASAIASGDSTGQPVRAPPARCSA